MNKDVTNYIGVFDSGVGGISVLKELTKLLPNENFLFFGDSANAPYGEKSVDEVKELSMRIAKKFADNHVKAIVVACNTATSAAITLLRETYPDFPIIGVEPALKPAALAPHHDSILVMATANTLKLDKFHALAKTFGEDVNVIPLACTGLANRIEEGRLDDDDLHEMLIGFLTPYVGKIDSVVLGCTHYPLIKKQITRVLGNVPLYDGGEGTARELKRRLEENHLLTTSQERGKIIFLSSKNEQEEIELYRKLYHLEA